MWKEGGREGGREGGEVGRSQEGRGVRVERRGGSSVESMVVSASSSVRVWLCVFSSLPGWVLVICFWLSHRRFFRSFTHSPFLSPSHTHTHTHRPDDEKIDTKIMEAVKARLPLKVDKEEGQAAVAAAAAAAESGRKYENTLKSDKL